MPVLSDWKVNITVDQILRAQGAEPDSIRVRRPALVQVAEWALQEGLPLLELKVAYERYPVARMRHENLELVGSGPQPGVRPGLSGRLIAQHLGPARQIVALVCTLGPALEEVVTGLMETDPLLGWALDALGSAAVEALSLEVCNDFEAQAAASGLQTSLPLSPGMVGWPVETGQHQIFSLVDAGEIGVALTLSSFMTPRKSLSMVIGIGKDLATGSRTCDFCSLNETCRYQNHYTPTGETQPVTYPVEY
jgi:hypothetical protein